MIRAPTQSTALSAYAEWAHLRHHKDDTREEQVTIQAAGRGASILAGVVRYRYGPRRVRLLAIGLELHPTLARALLLRVWEEFARQDDFQIADGMQWFVCDFRPCLHRWFSRREADLIIRQIRTFSPNPLSPPDVLNVIID